MTLLGHLETASWRKGLRKVFNEDQEVGHGNWACLWQRDGVHVSSTLANAWLWRASACIEAGSVLQLEDAVWIRDTKTSLLTTNSNLQAAGSMTGSELEISAAGEVTGCMGDSEETTGGQVSSDVSLGWESIEKRMSSGNSFCKSYMWWF